MLGVYSQQTVVVPVEMWDTHWLHLKVHSFTSKLVTQQPQIADEGREENKSGLYQRLL